MPIKIWITLLFSLLVMLILGIVCGGIYYFSYSARENTIQTRLENRSKTIGKFLEDKEVFTEEIIQRIDSLTTLTLKNKTVQAFDASNNSIYTYSDLPDDTLIIGKGILDAARGKGMHYFKYGEKEAVAYSYIGANEMFVIITSAKDIEGKHNLKALLKILIFSFFIGSLIVLLTGYLFSGRLMQPVKKITEEVEEISAQSLTKRIKTGPSKDEWYLLADTLNRLLNRLQESFELQRRFISNASHELYTPLTSVLSQIEVTLQRERTGEEYKSLLGSIYQDVNQLSKLTHTLLELAKASDNRGGIDIEKVRIDEVLFKLPIEIHRLDQLYTISLEFGKMPVNDESLCVLGNESLLLTALKNIVGNACKYSNDHQAKVMLEMVDEEIRIIVTDKGKGMSPDEIKNIFQPFYRGHNNIKQEGFGLGLSLSQKIVRLHKGSIQVTSELDKGSCFTVILPSIASNSETQKGPLAGKS